MANTKEPNYKEIVLLCLTEPNYSRLEFWGKHQKKSGYSKIIFYEKLKDALKYYDNAIEGKILEKESLGIVTSDYKIPLLLETGFKINGHLGRNEILFLNTELKRYYNSIFLSIEQMKKYDFTPEQIEQLLTWDNYEIPIQNNKGTFYASNIDGKIYTGKDAHKKIYFKDQTNPNFPYNCLDLVPEYYELIEAAYIEKQRQIAGSIFNEQAAKERFRLNEIESTKEKIQNNKEKWKHMENKPKFSLNSIQIFTHYLQFLNDLATNTQPNKNHNNSNDAETKQKRESDNNINVFCKPMPLNTPIEHFNVFTTKNSKNGNPYLSKEQLKMFIDKAFKGNQNIDKLTINYGTREKLFIVKRFYQFYTLAVDSFENTPQCKEKYIKLLTDNFTNWNFENIKHNFADKVKRHW